MDEFNLTSVHVSCLYYLYKVSTLTATELCTRCVEDKSNFSRSLDAPEQRVLIIRDNQQKKRYNCKLSLTENGKHICKKVS